MKTRESQREFSERVGVSEQTISRWFNGKADPDPDSVLKIAKACGVAYESINDDPPKNPLTISDKRSSIIGSGLGKVPSVFDPEPVAVGAGRTFQMYDFQLGGERMEGEAAGKLTGETVRADVDGCDVVAFRVAGTEAEPWFYAGDVIFLDLSRAPADGDCVVADLGDRAVFRRYYLRDGEVVLMPFNPRDLPIFTRGLAVAVVGVAVKMMRDL
jgi:transcriptional regulator with XRE-family HTH domain